jgi:membrane protease YdiL (CAAX protease family)
MDGGVGVSTVTSVSNAPSSAAPSTRPARPPSQIVTAVEVLLVYSGILLYIWRWQITHPRAWTALLAAVLLSHVAHGDTVRELGLTASGLRSNAESVLPIIVALYLPLLLYGFESHALTLIMPGKKTLEWFLSYGLWAAFQQYLAQSYFHNRLMRVVASRHLSSLLVAIMFGAAHIPNPVLMVATTIGGLIFSEAFARHRNVWPLALAHTAGGFLIAAVAPPWLLHNMRVGPGYFYSGRRY